MPSTCCVPMCNSNYNSAIKNEQGGKLISVFLFPKDANLKKKWLDCIPRDNFNPSERAVVCSKHFLETDIIREESFSLPDGTLKTIPCKAKLKLNSYPCIFPNLPKYLSKTVSKSRKTPEEREREQLARLDKANEQFQKSDLIENFDNFTLNIKNKITVSDIWSVKIVDNLKICFYTLNLTDDCLSINNEISVDKHMVVKVFVSGNQLAFNDLKWILPIDFKLTRWSQFENLLSRFQDTSYLIKNSESCVKYYIAKGLEFLNKALQNQHLDTDTDNSEDTTFSFDTLQLLIDQINLLTLNKKRYSTSTVIMSFMLYTMSPCAYDLMRKYISLPTKRYLQYLSSRLDIAPSPNNTDNNKSTTNYLNIVSSALKPNDKIVVLLIDEIYVSNRIDYRGKNLIGVAANDTSVATTILAFMICSAFGNFSEIVKLLPVHNIKGSEMAPITLDVINFVQRCGFQVLDVITDNHRINRSMFQALTKGSSFFLNPINMDQKIFTSYDFVHLFKNIINNWRNLKNLDQTFVYPDFNDHTKIKHAKYQDIKDTYIKEKDSIIKKAYKLNHKTIFPNNLERQKVYIADNICHSSTISALRDFNCSETADFLQIIRNWWEVVNNTSIYKGFIKRNDYCKPISGPDDFTVHFLKKFLLWLNAWHDLQNSNGHLTTDTFSALRHSTSVLLEIIDYSFQKFSISYLLPGKFTTEKLEKRFGQYRLLGGCNYNVSCDEVNNAEKKIRLKHIFKSASGNNFSISDIQHKSAAYCTDNDFSWDMPKQIPDIDKFLFILNSDYFTECEIDVSAQIYISGYAAHKIGKKYKCNICVSLVVESKGGFSTNEYFNNLQRGGLSIPTHFVKSVMFHTCAIFEKIISDPTTECEFLKTNNQKMILCDLTFRSIKQDETLADFFSHCVCGSENKSILKVLCSIFANVILNDFVKNKNSQLADSKAESKNKRRKLNTFK